MQAGDIQETGQNTRECQTSGGPVQDGKNLATLNIVKETQCQTMMTGVDIEKSRVVPSSTSYHADGSDDDIIGVGDNVNDCIDDFFRFDDNENFDEIVQVLVEACKETKRKDQLKE